MALKNVYVCEVCEAESADPAGWDYARLMPVMPAASIEPVAGMPLVPRAPDEPTMICPKVACRTTWVKNESKKAAETPS